MSDTMFTIAGISIKWYSVLILVGAILAIILALREGQRYKYSKDYIFNMMFWAIIFGVIGARLYYVLFNLNLYHNFWDIFKVWEGGLAIHGGIIFGLITIIIYCKRYHVSTLRMTDFVVPGLILAQAIGRWGNFFNGEAHGAATTIAELQHMHIPDFIINGMNIGGIYYQPTFLYESLWCLLGFLIILVIRRLKYTKVGQPTAFYLMWYSVGRFVIEGMRTDSLMLGGFRMAQIMSVVLFLLGLIIFMITTRRGRFENLYNKDAEQQINF